MKPLSKSMLFQTQYSHSEHNCYLIFKIIWCNIRIDLFYCILRSIRYVLWIFGFIYVFPPHIDVGLSV